MAEIAYSVLNAPTVTQQEIIDVTSSRLKDYGLFISMYNMELDYLKILIYKI